MKNKDSQKEISKKIRVLIVDDSPTKREIIAKMIEMDENMEVVGSAKDGIEAVNKCRNLQPDVVTMDIRMPVMDGIEATKRIMMEVPTPIVIVSSTAKPQVKHTMDALSIGALDFVAIIPDYEKMQKDLLRKLRIASKIKVVRYIEYPKEKKLEERIKPLVLPVEKINFKLLAIGVSTGGPTALLEILSKLPADFPLSIIIVQHMMGGFTQGLAEWLDKSCKIMVKEAQDGDKLKPGLALITPGDFNLTINSQQIINLHPIPDDAIYKPSIDQMMKSASEVFGPQVIGIILTGMGRDGVEGIKAIKEKGGATIAQDENTSVVFGMPKAAIETKMIDKVVPLNKIPQEIMQILKEGVPKR